MRIATYHTSLNRAGPGLLLRDILKGEDPQITAVAQVITHARPDIILLLGFDYDYNGMALATFADVLAAQGLSYPHRLALRPNTGMATGLDLDGNARLGEARDAMGWGRFSGEGGMALMSRHPFGPAVDYSAFLWRDLPGTLSEDSPEVSAIQRLSTTSHWQVPVLLPGNRQITLFAYHATPPVFDGPEDRNGRRNHDETAFWLRLLDGDLAFPPPDGPFALMGNSNLDPADGDGRRAVMAALLAHPAVQDPGPRGTSAHKDNTHSGDSALDTALFDKGLGGLRTDLVLPSADLAVTGAGVVWPPDQDPLAATIATASNHRLVWVDVALPD